MFEPNDKCFLDGVPQTVVKYVYPHTVEIEDACGTRRTSPEHVLARTVAPAPVVKTDLEVEQDKIAVSLVQKMLDEVVAEEALGEDVVPEEQEDPLRLWKSRGRISKLLMKLPIDWRGHFERGALWNRGGWFGREEARREELLLGDRGKHYFGLLTSADLRRLEEAAETGEPIEWVTLARNVDHFSCLCCKGGYSMETNGLVIRTSRECPHPDGLISEATLNVPSGKLAYDDQMHPLNPMPMDFDINKVWGCHERFLAHAEAGEILGQVGNSNPHIFRLADGSYQIGRYDQKVWVVETGSGQEVEVYERPEGGSEYGDDTMQAPPAGAVIVGQISTETWSYSFMDYDDARERAEAWGVDFEARCGNNGYGIAVLDVEPGMYRFRHFNNWDRDRDRDTDKWVAGAFERIGPPEEPQHLGRKLRELQVTAGQAVQIMQKAHASLYDLQEENMSPVRDALKRHQEQDTRTEEEKWGRECTHVLCDLFRGCVPSRDWHPNGFKNNILPSWVDGVEDREVPRFRFLSNAYFEDSIFRSTLNLDPYWGGDAPLNPSMAAAALRLLENQISWGCKPVGSHIPGSEERARNTMRSHVVYFRGILERYPEAGKGLEPFIAWLEDDAAVQLWIDHFSFEGRR